MRPPTANPSSPSAKRLSPVEGLKRLSKPEVASFAGRLRVRANNGYRRSGHWTGCYPRVTVATRVGRPTSRLVEGVPAGAGAPGRRIVDGEPGGLEAVDEVDLRFLEIRGAHLVDRHLHPKVLLGDIAITHAVVEKHGVPEAGTTTGLHRHPKHHIRLPLLLEELPYLAGRRFAELDHRPQLYVLI